MGSVVVGTAGVRDTFAVKSLGEMRIPRGKRPARVVQLSVPVRIPGTGSPEF